MCLWMHICCNLSVVVIYNIWLHTQIHLLFISVEAGTMFLYLKKYVMDIIMATMH